MVVASQLQASRTLENTQDIKYKHNHILKLKIIL